MRDLMPRPVLDWIEQVIPMPAHSTTPAHTHSPGSPAVQLTLGLGDALCEMPAAPRAPELTLHDHARAVAHTAARPRTSAPCAQRFLPRRGTKS